jgi:ATP adenylyltransferase
MKRIWAPWRMSYIKGPQKTGCIFCFDPSEDRSRLVLRREERAFVLLNKYPYTSGHAMVVPTAHVGRPEDLSAQDFAAVCDLLRQSSRAIQESLAPDGINIGMNIGKVAGAGVEDHLHFHIVPRWNGDHNFMPVVSEVRVINEHLEATYEKMLAFFQR